MATLVQQPEIANTQVSQLQAIEKPAKGSSLSDFIVRAVPLASEVVGILQEESKQHNLALGMNDALNQVTREVSWLDRKYYEQGRDIQTIQTAMVGMDNEVARNLYQRIYDNPDLSEEEALAEYYERNTTAVNAIFEADLDPDTKAKLYEAQLQAHAQQIKTVKGVYEQVGLEMEVRGRNARADSFVSAILTDGNAVDGQLAFGRLVTSAEAAYGRRGDLDDAQQHQAVQAEVKANLKAAVALLRNNTELGDTENLKLVDRLQESVQAQLNLQGIDGVDYSTWVEIDGDIKQLRDDLAKQSEDNFILQNTLDNVDYDAGVAEYTADVFNANIAKIQAAPITTSAKERLISQEVARYSKANSAKLGSEDAEYTGYDIVSGNMSMQDYNYLVGKPLDSSEEYNKLVSHYFKEQYGNTPEGRVQAAIAMIQYADEGGGKENNPALRRLGADLMWGSLTQYLSNPQSMNDEQFQRAEAYWGLLQDQYNRYAKSQPTRIADLLGTNTLTESQRMMMDRVLRDGGSLKRAINDFQRSDDLKGNVDAFKAGVNSWTIENTGITSFWGNGSLVGQRNSFAGNLFADMQGVPNAATRDAINATTLKNLKDVIGNQSAYKLAEQFGVVTPEQAVQFAPRHGMIIPSRSRYNAAIININAAQVLDSNSAIPDGVRGVYNSRAIDSMIYEYAKEYNIEPSNVFVTTRDSSGRYVHFQHLTKDGILNDEPKTISIDAIRNRATGIYRRQREETVNPKVTKPVVGTQQSREQYGFVTKPTKQEKYSYTPNKPIGKLQLTAKNKEHYGQKFNVTVPAQAAVMFNGNSDLTMAAIQHLGIKEGLFLKVQDVEDKTTGKRSTNGALQISLTQNPKWESRIRKAEGNAQELMNIQGDFLAEYFGKLQESAARVGSPIARENTPYPAAHKFTQFYLMDLMYHGGNSTDHIKRVESTLAQRNESVGLSKLKQLPAYKSSGAARQQFLEKALIAHYKVKKAERMR